MAVKDKYQIQRKYITNKLARGGSKLKELRYFVAHETANNSADADAHYRYFQNIKIQASAHTFVDDNKILEIIPINEKAWHVQYNNDKKTLGLGAANDYAIGTELCRTGSFKDAYDRYVWYHAYLCKKFGKQPKKHITAHKFEDPARRSDPQSWLEPNGVTWGKFISDVQEYFDNWEGEAEKVEVPSKPVAKPKASKPKPVIKKASLVVDGLWGKATTKALQKHYGTPVDGIISGQPKNNNTRYLFSASYGSGGSMLIRAMQRDLGTPADGIVSYKSTMIKALQRKYGTPVDGYLSYPSTLIKEMQKQLNNGTF